METGEAIIRGALRPERWARMEAVLDRRLGAVRVVLEDLHHPHNMSAVLRTCEALGVQHVHAVEPRNPFTVSRRISRGTHKWLHLHHHERVTECAGVLHALGFRLYGAVLSPEAVALEEIPVEPRVALIFGNEKEGVSREAAALCDGAFTIPMAGFVQSFNISVAAAISLYSLTRRVRELRPDRGLLTPAERDEVLAAWLPKSLHCGRRIVRAAEGSRGG